MATSDNVGGTLKQFAESAEKIMRVPALKGRLGGADFFIVTLTLAELARYMMATDPNLPPKLRENRRPNPARFKEIAEYITRNSDDYRFSAITCTYGKDGTDRPVRWEPADPDAPQGAPGWMLGMLTLSQDDPLIIVDGQHRFGAIGQAIEAEPELRNDSIAVVLFPYLTIKAAQQLFSDLNRTVKKTTKSLDILFDHRDIMNRVTQGVVDRVSVFGDLVNVELVSVARSQTQVFTLAGVYQATKPMADAASVASLVGEGVELEPDTEPEYIDFLVHAWEFIAEQFPEWGKVARGEMDIARHRQEYLHWNSGVVSTVGEFVGIAMRERHQDWKSPVRQALTHPDNQNWRRNASRWEGIVTVGDQVLPRSMVRVQLLTYLKLRAGLKLRQREQNLLDTLQAEDPEVRQKMEPAS